LILKQKIGIIWHKLQLNSMSILEKIFGGTQRVVGKYHPIVEKINELETQFQVLSDEQLKGKTSEFKGRLQKGETLDDILSEAFAAVREASRRTLGMRHFDVQLIGGMVLHEGKIAEMKTGEGKTLAATLAIYLNALEGKGVHVVTVNDYLAKRDLNWMGPIYHALGLTAGCIQHEAAFVFEPTKMDRNEVTVEMQNLKSVKRHEAYEADITYGINNEFGFDYLRDNMVDDISEMVQREHHYAIVDEVDSILIDEARTPLIISAPDMESTKLYETFAKVTPHLKKDVDYTLDEKMRTSMITEAGIEKVEKMLGLQNIYAEGGIKYVHHLEQALRAETLFRRDKEYVVKDGEIIIVDEFTGRLMPGRRYSEGLHQAIEAKEGVTVQKESRTLATITFQNYFRMYKKLAGMTGTALTSAEEMNKVYKLDVVPVPTNKPMGRVDMPDSIYRTERGKFTALVREIKERHEKSQPVLVGTVSIEKNEILSAFLKKEGIPHELLNAKNHEREAQIISKAGAPGAVTIATNMAGRGVDIILGGHPEEDNEEAKKEWEKNHQKVVAAGGLHVVGTERHEARRIDDQLRGRAGRQGDPGSSQFFVSLEDDLMRIFAADRIKKMMEFLKMPEDEPIENKMVSKAIESAQGKIEGFNFDTRKHVLEYDDVMNKQRETIYRKRREILASKDIKENVEKMIADEVAKIVDLHTMEEYRDGWKLDELADVLNNIMPLPNDVKEQFKNAGSKDDLVELAQKMARDAYELKEKTIGVEQSREIERLFYLRTLDMLWMDHLDQMEHLRDSVRLRAYGQRDPLVEYKNEGHKLFQELLGAIQGSFVNAIYKVTLNREPQPQHREQMTTSGPVKTSGGNPGKNNPGKKEVGRNDPCPCGSGKKYKRCCGA